MSFLIDTDVCSAYLKGDGRVFNRFMQHSGGLYVSAITAGELFSWALRAAAPPKRLQGLFDLFSEAPIIAVDHDVAKRFGEVRAALLEIGISVPTADLMIASTALLYDLTVATHNVKDYARVPHLRIEDWLS